MAANVITLGRIFLTIPVILLFQGGFLLRIAAVLLIILVIYLDALDGIVARKLGQASDFGALFDITGDRIVEHIFWIFFMAIGLVSMWVPIVFISRSFLVDSLRTVAYTKEGKTPFGEKTMMQAGITHFLTVSRFSRSVYGVGKVMAFVFLGIILVLQVSSEQTLGLFPKNFLQDFILTTNIIVWIVVAMNLVRGLPVLWDGRLFLFDKQFPRALKDAL